MAITILSYNLWQHQAYGEIAELARRYQTDIVCLQECVPALLEDRLGDLRLVDKATLGPGGLAIYCRAGRFRLVNSASYSLAESWYERRRPAERYRLLAALLQDEASDQQLLVASFHAVHLWASNLARRRQTQEALQLLAQKYPDVPVIMIGDYNYPFFQRGLERVVRRQAYTLVRPIARTYKRPYFWGKFDMAATRGIDLTTVTALAMGRSDHAPILAKVKLAR